VSTRPRVGPSGWLEIVLSRVAHRPVLENFDPWSRPTNSLFSAWVETRNSSKTPSQAFLMPNTANGGRLGELARTGGGGAHVHDA